MSEQYRLLIIPPGVINPHNLKSALGLGVASPDSRFGPLKARCNSVRKLRKHFLAEETQGGSGVIKTYAAKIHL